MTPARFDLLHVIYNNSRWGLARGSTMHMCQYRVVARLGLARQTVWKMVKRLVELGFLKKWPYPGNPRWISLQLTPEGVRLIRKAYGVAFAERHFVSPEEGGMDAPRHVHELVRRHAAHCDRVAKMYPRLPGASRKYLEAWWGPSEAPPKVGREVAKVFTSFAWKRAGEPPRGRRTRSLRILEDLIRDAEALAQALGDESELIYSRPDPPKPPPELSRIDPFVWRYRPDIVRRFIKSRKLPRTA